MRIRRIYLWLIVAFASLHSGSAHSGWFSRSPCLHYQLLSDGKSGEAAFKLGSRIHFWNENLQTSADGYFIGAQVGFDGNVKGFYVFGEGGGQLHFLPEELVTFENAKFQKRAVGAGPKIAEAAPQTDDTCGALASLNCLLTLRVNGKLPGAWDSLLFPESSRKKYLGKLLQRLYPTSGHFKEREQVDEIGALLRETGVPYSLIRNDMLGRHDQELFEHLRAGNPAIVISQVRWEWTNVPAIHHGPSTQTSRMPVVLPTYRGPDERAHAFLALGMFKTTDGHDFMIVQDSDFISVVPAGTLRPHSDLRRTKESKPSRNERKPPLGPPPVEITSFLVNDSQASAP